jgi:hypothetical protein
MYTKELLLECMKRDNAIIKGEYEKFRKNDRYSFVCYCGEENEKAFYSIYKEGGAYCKKCTKKITDEKRRLTNIEKYGSPYTLQNKEIREKGNNTIKEKYGVDNISQLQSTKEKVKETNREKFGVDYPAKNPEIIKKMVESNIRIRGVKNPGCCPIVKEKMKQTSIEKYGVNYTFQSKEVRDKIHNTMIDRYGVKHALQNSDINERQINKAYSFKEVKTPSGKIVKMQGFEPYAYKILLDTYTEDEIISNRKEVPEIWWVDGSNKKHRYYVDFYIPKDNFMVEIKSTRTFDKDNIRGKIDGIKKECLKRGYKFEIWIIDAKGNIIKKV